MSSEHLKKAYTQKYVDRCHADREQNGQIVSQSRSHMWIDLKLSVKYIYANLAYPLPEFL